MKTSKIIFSAILVLFILPVLSSGQMNGPSLPSGIVLKVTGPEILASGQVYQFEAISEGVVEPSQYVWIFPEEFTVAPEEGQTGLMATNKIYIRLKAPNVSGMATIKVRPTPTIAAIYTCNYTDLKVGVLKIDMLTPAGDKTPNQNPDLTNPGQNIYCFNDNGELTISLSASSDPLPAINLIDKSKFVLNNFDAETVVWTKQENERLIDVSIFENTTLFSQAKITQFPDDASKGIGLNQASFLYISSTLASASYEVFFPPDKSLTKDGISTPLWFLYWKSMGALDDMGDFIYGGRIYEDGEYRLGYCKNEWTWNSPGSVEFSTTLTLYKDAANIDLIKNYTIYGQNNVNITTEYPIESVACTILHELKHKEVQGKWTKVIYEEADRRLRLLPVSQQNKDSMDDKIIEVKLELDVDGDMILDADEAGLGVGPGDPYSITSKREDKEVVADKAMIDYKDIIHYDLDYSKGGQLWNDRNGIE